jgi:hypothetical protein
MAELWMTVRLFGSNDKLDGARTAGAIGILALTLLTGSVAPAGAQSAQSPGGAAGAVKQKPDTSDPLIARYDGGQITLHELETFAREMPMAQRIPFARNAGDWRRFMAGELAKMTALTSQAKTMGYQMEPGYLRARDYFINEYLCYLVLRNNVNNRIDLSAAAQRQEYETGKADFWASATVTLRMIRTRDAAAVTSAAKALAGGADFRDVEMKVSQVSPRYRGNVLGPFPSAEKRTAIPPPDEVIQAAMAQGEGQTTGPFDVRGFHYIVKTEKKTPGRQLEQSEVPERLEQRLREHQMARLIPPLVDKVQKELAVVVDEPLFASPSTNPNDVLATVGTVRITRREYVDLNGTVRGPAAPIAQGLPTKLKQFVLPYMLAEWARANGYLDLPETKRAIYYYDLQHLASNVEMELGMKLLPPPTDEQLRAKFQQNIQEFRKPGGPEPKFEDHRQDMLDAAMQGRAPEAQQAVRAFVLQKLNFQVAPAPMSANCTAYEAVRIAQSRLTTGVKLLEVSPVELPKTAGGATQYYDYGRAPQWRVVYKTTDGQTSHALVAAGGVLLNGEQDYKDIPALKRWLPLWRFDTDALKRHAIDKELGDFVARYENRVQVAARVDFTYSGDDPSSPTECRIVYTAVPVDPGVKDGFEVTYSGQSGDVVRREYGYQENRCLTCPGGAAAKDGQTSGSAEMTKYEAGMATATAGLAGEKH